MKVLITGSNGLLGQKLVKNCLESGVDFIATSIGKNRNPDCPDDSYTEIDITDPDNIHQVFETHKPSHIIHTAAITNVDHCELNPDECEEVNVIATEQLVEAANEVGAHFQFISTDFVFDGLKGNYVETDAVNPLSVYASSKVKGEEIVKAKSHHGWSIVRTIIVYGVGNNLSRSNLIVWAKGALEKGEKLNIIDDQFRAPTYADDLAEGCMSIIRRKKNGIFHICGPQTYSIFEIVKRIADHFGYDMSSVSKISSATLNQPAKRPPKTGFDLTKAYEELAYQPHTLEETLGLLFA